MSFLTKDYSEVSNTEVVKAFGEYAKWAANKSTYEATASNEFLSKLEDRCDALQQEDKMAWDDFGQIIKICNGLVLLEHIHDDDYDYLGRVCQFSAVTDDAIPPPILQTMLDGLSAFVHHVEARVAKDSSLKKDSFEKIGEFYQRWTQPIAATASHSPMQEELYQSLVRSIIDIYSHRYAANVAELLGYIVNLYSSLAYSVGGGLEQLVDAVVWGCGRVLDRISENKSWDLERDADVLQQLSSLYQGFSSAPSIPPEKVNNVPLLCRFLKVGTMQLPAEYRRNSDLKSSLESLAQSASYAFAQVQAPTGGEDGATHSSGGGKDDMIAILDVTSSCLAKIPPHSVSGLVTAANNYSDSYEARTVLFTVESITTLENACKKDPMQTSWTPWFSILKECSAEKPEVAAHFIDSAVDAAKKMANSAAGLASLYYPFQTFRELGKISPVKTAAHFNTLKGLASKASGQMRGMTDLGMITFCRGLCVGFGASHPEAPKYAKEMLEICKSSPAPDSVLNTFVMESVSMMRISKDLISPEHLEYIRSLKNSPGNYGVDSQAIAFIDEYEGRTLENFGKQIDEQNAKIKEACKDFDSLKKYVDENMNEMKDFVAQVAKKLPVPARFNVEQKMYIQKIITLVFECPYKKYTQELDGGADNEYIANIESKEWSKWLKMSLSAVKIGKSVMTGEGLADVGDVMEQTKKIFKAYTQQDDEAFLTYCQEPFLTSQEQDFLVQGLRDAKFFERFAYDAKTAQWVAIRTQRVLEQADKLALGRDFDAIIASKSKLDLSGPIVARSAPDDRSKSERAADAMASGAEAGQSVIESAGKVVSTWGWCFC